jgi:hypothetical protein
VTKVPRDRPHEAREDDAQRDDRRVDDPGRDGCRDFERVERAGEVENGGDEHGRSRRERLRGDARGDRVRRVVEAVREVEEERDGDDRVRA